MQIIIALLVAGILLVLAEIVIPGGLAGMAGVTCLAIGVFLAFKQSASFGVAVLVGVIIGGLVIFWLWVKFFPSSRFGKKLFLEKDAGDWRGYDEGNEKLKGQSGTAATILRPAGVVMIGDKRVDVVTQGEMIEKGASVTVVLVEGNRIVVEAAAPAEQEEEASAQ